MRNIERRLGGFLVLDCTMLHETERLISDWSCAVLFEPLVSDFNESKWCQRAFIFVDCFRIVPIGISEGACIHRLLHNSLFLSCLELTDAGKPKLILVFILRFLIARFGRACRLSESVFCLLGLWLLQRLKI